ncbi:MAG: hypothetical protein ACFFDW_01820 [Candidatus Thorarchaeota archaeon]
MPLMNSRTTESDLKATQKEIENGILKAIADISNEEDWPEDADAFDVQSIITQLARSAAHLRDSSRIESEEHSSIRKIHSR